MAQPITLTTEGLLLNWLKGVGDSVNAGDIIAEVEADKATVEIEAPASGVLLEQNANVGDELEEGTVIGSIGEAGEAPAPAAAPSQPEPKADTPPTPAASNGVATSSTTEDGRIKASPVARNIAAERGIDLSQVKGTGPGGRIVKADVENFTPSAAPSPAPAVAEQTYGKLPEASDRVEIVDVSRMRRAIADNTINSFRNIPHFFVTVDMDVEPLLKLRKVMNTSLESEGIKISVNDMMVKATALCLRKFPNLNSHYYGDKLVRYKDINIGVAVALPNNGLMNVVAHNADTLALSELAVRNKAMYERAREGKIKPDDLKGATFTISNLGPYNIESFSAIISPPEAGILAISSTMQVPIVLEDGTLGVGSRMKVTLSVDHRVSDGAEGAQFLNEFRDLVEHPMRLLV